MGHVIRGQAAGLVVLLSVHMPVQVGHRNVFFLYYSFHSSTTTTIWWMRTSKPADN